MVAKSIAIDISNMPDVLRLVDQAQTDNVTLLLERNGQPIAELSRHTPPTSEMTPDRRRRILESVVGAWRDMDTDTLIDDLYRRRETTSRPPVVFDEPSL